MREQLLLNLPCDHYTSFGKFAMHERTKFLEFVMLLLQLALIVAMFLANIFSNFAMGQDQKKIKIFYNVNQQTNSMQMEILLFCHCK